MRHRKRARIRGRRRREYGGFPIERRREHRRIRYSDGARHGGTFRATVSADDTNYEERI